MAEKLCTHGFMLVELAVDIDLTFVSEAGASMPAGPR
jgi:hypothetical protein